MAETLADRLRQAREKAGLTQAEAAGLVGITRQTVSQYEGGESMPRVDYAVAIARAAKWMVEWIVTGEGPRERMEEGDARETLALIEAAIERLRRR